MQDASPSPAAWLWSRAHDPLLEETGHAKLELKVDPSRRTAQNPLIMSRPSLIAAPFS